MSDGNGGDGGRFGGLFGQAGAREIKKVTGETELIIPLRQTFWLWMLGWGAGVFLYVVARLWVTNKGDWLLGAGIFSLVAAAPLVYRGRRLLGRLWPIHYEDGDTVHIEWDVLVVFLVVVVVGFVALELYLATVRSIIEVLFNAESNVVNWIIIILTLGAIGGVLPLWAGSRFFIRQLVDSLYDSDYHVNVRARELQWERERYYREHRQPDHTDDTMPVLVRARATPLTAREINRRALKAFVYGLATGKIKNTERDWNTKEALGDSGRALTLGFARKMRTYLIAAGLMEWVDTQAHTLGVRLVGNIEDIIADLDMFEKFDDNGEENNGT